MMDYEEKILSRQDDVYDGLTVLDDVIEVRRFNPSTYQYDTIKTLRGQAAREYMEENGIR